MEWLLLALLAPLVLAPVVLLWGFAGCGSFLPGPVTASSPPTSLIADRTGDRTITLRWTHSDATAKFNISRGESSGSLTPVPAVQSVTGIQVDDTNLPEGTAFFYSIATVDPSGTSDAFTSSESSATTRPAAPTGLVATPALNSIALAWTNESTKATRFMLERPGASYEVAQGGSTTVTHADTATASGVTYEYSLRSFVNGVNKGVAERVTSAPDVKVTASTLIFKPVYPPSTGTPVPLATDQAASGFCFVVRIGTDRLENSGSIVRLTISGGVSGPLVLSAVTISHAVPVGEAWDSSALPILVGTNVTVAAATPLVLDPESFALDKTKPLLVSFDVSPTPGQGNVRFGALVDAQTKTYFKAATQAAQMANRAFDFQPSNNVYIIDENRGCLIMANALTGDYEAVLQVSIRQVNGLLATLHQNGDIPMKSPHLPHGVSMLFGEGLASGGASSGAAGIGPWIAGQKLWQDSGNFDIYRDHAVKVAAPGAAVRLSEAITTIQESLHDILRQGQLHTPDWKRSLPENRYLRNLYDT